MIAPHIETVLRRWGLTCVYEGYFCLIHAVQLVEKDPLSLEAYTKHIYPHVARQCGLTTSDVDSAIRTAIRVCCRRNGPEVAQFCGDGSDPSVTQFLSGLCRCIQSSGGSFR